MDLNLNEIMNDIYNMLYTSSCQEIFTQAANKFALAKINNILI